MIAVVTGVLSHNPAFATAGQLAGAMVFHVACMVPGMYCLQRAAARRAAALKSPASV